jgi:hypothetical protein
MIEACGSEYPYLWGSLLLAAAGLLVLVLSPRDRRLAALGGMLSLPSALFAFQHVPHYWNPRIALPMCAVPLITGEDLLYCFGMGTLATWLALRTCGHRLVLAASPAAAAGRYLLVGIGGAIVAQTVHALLLEPHQVMVSCLVGLFAAGMIVAIARPGLMVVGLLAGPLFAALFALLLLGCGWLWPHAAQYYNPAAQPSWNLLGLPAWEVLFPLCFATIWPCIVAWCGAARIVAEH